MPSKDSTHHPTARPQRYAPQKAQRTPAKPKAKHVHFGGATVIPSETRPGLSRRTSSRPVTERKSSYNKPKLSERKSSHSSQSATRRSKYAAKDENGRSYEVIVNR
ncbi:hypothetical protein BAUCODRAFT_20760 [Baudoinia panamericana UAMH 10762]|uniref:Uncharacterized protein n=1 Tax=Baudoinia panamericana (strain UAMH 10762) TaxID=717646 RepID=M2MUU1_BAUPA|nr:uncharacterized protein BAUCODRAFT_20760 [Baudoinia panamericana UAMH 10762]EMD00712.1 hypothetical protein BAUCODRAFT_20760 [Baudoinia panamericana UAMH 10762]